MERTVIFGVYDYSPTMLGYTGFYFKEEDAHKEVKERVERIMNNTALVSKYRPELVIEGSAYILKGPSGHLEKVGAVHAIMVQ